MPSATLVHSFPVPLGRRGTAAAAVIALHVLLVAALITGIAVQMPKVDIVQPPPPVHPQPRPATPLGRTADTPDRWTFTRPIVDDSLVPPAIPTVTHDPDTLPGPPVVEPQPAPAQTLSGARLLRSEQPPYPAAARRLGEEGVVLVRVLVGPDGHATLVELAASSGSPRLDEAAVASVRHWLFRAATSASGPVASWTTLRVVFRLTE